MPRTLISFYALHPKVICLPNFKVLAHVRKTKGNENLMGLDTLVIDEVSTWFWSEPGSSKVLVSMFRFSLLLARVSWPGIGMGHSSRKAPKEHKSLIGPNAHQSWTHDMMMLMKCMGAEQVSHRASIEASWDR